MAHDSASLQGRIRTLVLQLGRCSIGQLLSILGDSICADEAMTAYRRQRRFHKKGRKPATGRPSMTVELCVVSGKKRLIAERLGRLCKLGIIRRVERGVYAPPLPRAYRPQEKAS